MFTASAPLSGLVGGEVSAVERMRLLLLWRPARYAPPDAVIIPALSLAADDAGVARRQRGRNFSSPPVRTGGTRLFLGIFGLMTLILFSNRVVVKRNIVSHHGSSIKKIRNFRRFSR